VLVTGSLAERSLAAALVEGAGIDVSANLAGKTDLRQLTALVRGAGLVVSGDTGIAHLATAVGAPSVVLFGPTAPGHWGPPLERTQHVVLWSGRTGDPHADRPDRGLLDIGVEDVLRAAERARAERSLFATSEVAT
jgi:ADP-heptose:LPS heptosyltransferase